MNDIDLVTPADHEAGFKILEVALRAGSTQRVKLTAPTRRQSRTIGEAIMREQDAWPVVAACRPQVVESGKLMVDSPEPSEPSTINSPNSPLTEEWLDKLTPASADLVEVTSFALTFGQDFQKKMVAAAALWMTDWAKSAPKSTSSAAATA